MGSEEAEVIEDLHTATAMAIRNHDSLEKSDLKYLTKTKLHKLFYFAVEESPDVTATYSWYLAGAHIASPGVDPKKVGKKIGELDEHGIPRTSGWGSLQDTDIEKVTHSPRKAWAANHSISDHLNEVWYASRYEFLNQFYRNNAPSRYLPLYEQSLKIRKRLNSIRDDIRSTEESGRQASLYNFSDDGAHGDSPLTRYIGEFESLLDEFEAEVQTYSELGRSANGVHLFADVCIDLIEEISQQPVDEIDPRLESALEDLSEIFYSVIWQWPCLHISIETATGPHWSKVVADREDRLNWIEEHISEKVEEIRYQAGME